MGRYARVLVDSGLRGGHLVKSSLKSFGVINESASKKVEQNYLQKRHEGKHLLVMDNFATCFVIFRLNPERYKYKLFMPDRVYT